MGVWGTAVAERSTPRVEDRALHARVALAAYARSSGLLDDDSGNSDDYSDAGYGDFDEFDGYGEGAAGCLPADEAGASTWPGTMRSLGGAEAVSPDTVIHLLSDLMHVTMTLDADFSRLLSAAQRHFCEERVQDLG